MAVRFAAAGIILTELSFARGYFLVNYLINAVAALNRIPSAQVAVIALNPIKIYPRFQKKDECAAIGRRAYRTCLAAKKTVDTSIPQCTVKV